MPHMGIPHVTRSVVMSPQKNSPVFFVSYARRDFEYPVFREFLNTFVNDIAALVAQNIGRSHLDIAYIDVNDIHAGELWSPELADSLKLCAVGMPLFSPNYFTRESCGKEFQVFLDRSNRKKGSSGIVPVRWANRLPPLPTCAKAIQLTDQSFPVEYTSMGMQQLLQLRAALPGKYELTINALANRVVDAFLHGALQPIGEFDFDTVVSAWDVETAGDPQSHTKGNISKTCFVYVARDGWDWMPYEGNPSSIGAMAQQISGELGVRYEEIPCDAGLASKLKAANASDVPTILLADPNSFADDRFAQPMKQYDSQYLLNCGTLVAWDGAAREALDENPLWIGLLNVCRQKIAEPPANHDWRSIFSRGDLEQKTRLVIERIRSRLMKQLLAEPVAAGTASVRRATDPATTANAALQGISTDILAQLANSTK